jgi:hypothetical protein
MAESQSRQEQEDALRESYLSGDQLSGVSEAVSGLRSSVREFEQDNPPEVRVPRTAYAGQPSIRRAIAGTAAPALEQANSLRNVELDYGPRSVPGQVRSAEEYEARLNPSPAPAPSTPQRSPFLGGGSRWSRASQDELRASLGAALGEATGLPGPVNIDRINARQSATAGTDRSPRTIGADLYRQTWDPGGAKVGGIEATTQTPGVEWSQQAELRPARVSTPAPASRNAGVEGKLSGDSGMLRGARQVAGTLDRMARVASPEFQEYALETYGRNVTPDDLGVYVETDKPIRMGDVRRAAKVMRTGTESMRRAVIDQHALSGGEGILNVAREVRRSERPRRIKIDEGQRLGARDTGVRKIKTNKPDTWMAATEGERSTTIFEPGEVSADVIRSAVTGQRLEDVQVESALRRDTDAAWSSLVGHSRVGAGGGGKQFDKFGNPVPVQNAMEEEQRELKTINEDKRLARQAQAMGEDVEAFVPRRHKPSKPVSVLRGGGASTFKGVNVERTRMTAPPKLPSPNAPAIAKGEMKVYNVEPTVTSAPTGRRTLRGVNEEVAAGLSPERLDKLVAALAPAPPSAQFGQRQKTPAMEGVKRERGQLRRTVTRKKTRTQMRAQEAEDLMNPEAAAERKARQEANAARVRVSGLNDRNRGLSESLSRAVQSGNAEDVGKIRKLLEQNEAEIESLGGVAHSKRKRESGQGNTLF